MAAKKVSMNDSIQNGDLKRSWQQRKRTAATPERQSNPHSQSSKKEPRPREKHAPSTIGKQPTTRFENSSDEQKKSHKKSVSFAANEKSESDSLTGNKKESTPKKRKLDATDDDVPESNGASKRFRLTPNNWQKRQQAGAKKKSKSTKSNGSKTTTSQQTSSKPVKSEPKEKQTKDSAPNGSEVKEPKTEVSKTEPIQNNGIKSKFSKPQISKPDSLAPRQEVHKEILRSGKNFKITKTTTTTKPAQRKSAPAAAEPEIIHSTHIPEPKGLVDQLSTSEWDMYSEKMPSPAYFVPAILDRVEDWLGQQDSALITAMRVEQYGQDIVDTFPAGGTPGFARRICAEREAEDEDEDGEDE